MAFFKCMVPAEWVGARVYVCLSVCQNECAKYNDRLMSNPQSGRYTISRATTKIEKSKRKRNRKEK